MEWFSTEVLALVLTAATVGVVHTLLGPDHYLPFVALSRSKRWTLRRTLAVTGACGIGHVAGSIVLGALGIALGSGLAGIIRIESIRGDIAAWLMLTLGLVYLAWGLKQAARGQVHAHPHVHADGSIHTHQHDHRSAHLHLHGQGANRVAPWALFIVFALGPCEALIPILMYPAAQHNYAAVALVAAVFAVATLATMLVIVALGCVGATRLRFGRMDRYAHALAGGAISLCAIGMLIGF